MEFSQLLLKKIVTLVLMILMGLFSVKSGRLKSEDSRVISQLCFDWVIPFSLVNAFLIGYDPEIAREFGWACLLAAAVIFLFVVISLGVGKALRLNPSETGTLMFSNSAGMTLPLAQALLGSTGVLLCAPHMGLQNLTIFCVLPMIMSDKADINWKKLLLNRNLLAIIAGVCIFLFRIQLPEVLRDTISGVGGMIAPLSMFMIGMLMAKINFRQLLADRKLYLVCAFRLLLYPLLMIALISLTGLARQLPFLRNALLVLTMCIASPAATLVTQMATAHRSIEEAAHAGSLNVITTLLCVVTIPVMVLIFQWVC